MSDLGIDFVFDEPAPEFELPELTFDYATEDLPERLIERGVTHLLIEVAGYSEYVFVEDDAEFLADAYLALIRIIKERHEKAVHSVVLGDGRVMIGATIAGTNVRCTVQDYPQLRRDLGSSRDLTLSLRGYAHGWWRAIQQLIAPLNTSQE